jgi:hypothetical protein
MSTSILQPAVQPPIDMPFRLLAGVLGIAGVVAVVGTPILIWRGARILTVGNVVMLPLMIWFIRWTLNAALFGRTSRDGEWWPFASLGVWRCYLVLMVAYWLFKA